MSTQNNDDENNEIKPRPHKADGIEEYDYPLPNWWVVLFAICIAFAAVYMPHIHLGKDKLLEDELLQDQLAEKKRLEEKNAQSKSSGDGSENANPHAMYQDPTRIAQGKEVYTAYCVPCHRTDLGGQIGPNLTDEYWLHGCTPEKINAIITDGAPAKGMAAWGPILGPDKIIDVTAYILAQVGTKPADPKEPQGEKCSFAF